LKVLTLISSLALLAALIGAMHIARAQAQPRRLRPPCPVMLQTLQRNPSIKGAVRWARAGSESHFILRASGRPNRKDFQYEIFTEACGPAIVSRTVYVDLHPPGMECQACDSHEYIGRTQSGKYKAIWAG
jgi:hypothetical protein